MPIPLLLAWVTRAKMALQKCKRAAASRCPFSRIYDAEVLLFSKRLALTSSDCIIIVNTTLGLLFRLFWLVLFKHISVQMAFLRTRTTLCTLIWRLYPSTSIRQAYLFSLRVAGVRAHSAVAGGDLVPSNSVQEDGVALVYPHL